MKINDKKFTKSNSKQPVRLSNKAVRAAMNPIEQASAVFDVLAQLDIMQPELGVAPPEPKKQLVPIHEGMWDPRQIKREFRKMRQTGLTDEAQAIDRIIDLGAAGAGKDDAMVRNYMRVLWYHSMSPTPFKEWLYRKAQIDGKFKPCKNCFGEGVVDTMSDQWDWRGEAHYTKDGKMVCPECKGTGVDICPICFESPVPEGMDACEACMAAEKEGAMDADTLSKEEIQGTGKIGQLDLGQQSEPQQGAPALSPMPSTPPPGEDMPEPNDLFNEEPGSDMPLDEALQQLQEAAEAVVDKVNSGETIMDGKPMEPVSEDTGPDPSPAPKIAQTKPEDPSIPPMMLKDQEASDSAKSLTMTNLVEKMKAIQEKLKNPGKKEEEKPKAPVKGLPGTKGENTTDKLNRIFGKRYERIAEEYGPGVAKVEFMLDFIKDTFGRFEDKISPQLALKLKHADADLLTTLSPTDLKMAFTELQMIDNQAAENFAKSQLRNDPKKRPEEGDLKKVKTAPSPEVEIGESKKKKFQELSDRLKKDLMPKVKVDPKPEGAYDPTSGDPTKDQLRRMKEKMEQLLKKQIEPEIIKAKDVVPRENISLRELTKQMFPKVEEKWVEPSKKFIREREPNKPSGKEFIPEKKLEKESVDQDAKQYWHSAYGEYGDQMTRDRIAEIADMADEIFDAYGIKLTASEFSDVVAFISDDTAAEGAYEKVAEVKSLDPDFANVVDKAMLNHIASTASYKNSMPKFAKSAVFTLAVHSAGIRDNVMKYVADKMKTPKPAGSQGDSFKVEKMKDEAKDSKPTARSEFIEFKVDDSFVQGVYTHLNISWKKDDAANKSDEGLKQAIISFVKGLESHKEHNDLGFLGKIHVVDVGDGKAEVKFRTQKGGDAVKMVRNEK